MLTKIKDNWVVLMFIISMIVTWTRFDFAIKRHDEQINIIERTLERNDSTYLQIQKDIVEIKTSLEFIKVQLGQRVNNLTR